MNGSPIDLIREEYRLHPREESFQVYLDWHIENGFVFSTPQFFIMGRAANRESLERNSEVWSCPRELQDCWYVFAASGNLSKAWDILPYELPYIAFERMEEDGSLRLTVVKTERMKRLSHAIPQPSVA
jgi:hypothetical protein